MSAKEYNTWIADYMIEPWGESRQDIRSGMIVQSVRAQYSKEGVILKDCIVNFDLPEKKKRQSGKEMSRMLRNYTVAMGGKVT